MAGEDLRLYNRATALYELERLLDGTGAVVEFSRGHAIIQGRNTRMKIKLRDESLAEMNMEDLIRGHN